MMATESEIRKHARLMAIYIKELLNAGVPEYMILKILGVNI